MGIGNGTKELLKAFGNEAVRTAFPLSKLVDEGITKVAVDTTPWLVNAYKQLQPHQKIDPKRDELYAEIFKKNCREMIEVLKNNGFKPFLVFDGNATPLKTQIKELKPAISDAKDKECVVAIPVYKWPRDNYIPDFFETIKWMRQEIKVDFIVAPYEADAQLTHLATTCYVHAVRPYSVGC